jgi:Matrixin
MGIEIASRPPAWRSTRVHGACWVAVLVGILLCGTAWGGPQSAPDEYVGAPPIPRSPAFTYDDFLLLPVRVHLLEAPDVPALNCRLRVADVRRIMAKVQAIWRPAGICFYLESVVREAAVNRSRFTADHDPWDLDALLDVRPPTSKCEEALHVYFLHELAVNGVWLGEAIFVMDAARLLHVEGGSDEPLPRVTSHELGHALGLRHRQDRTNLMASGTTGTSLNGAEIAHARANARTVGSAQTPGEAADAAERLLGQGDRAAARRLYALLAGLPGESAVKRRAARRLSELPARAEHTR